MPWVEAQLSGAQTERLLEILQREAGSPAARFAEAPSLLGFGGDALVYGFRLRGVSETWARPLVVRLLRSEAPERQLHWDAGLHAGLGEMSFPVPEIALSCEGDPVLDRFQVMTRLTGRMLLEDVFGTAPAALVRRPLRLARMVREALFVVPRLLGETQAQLHELDPGPVERALRERGFGPEDWGIEGQIEQVATRLGRAGGGSELEPVVDWLRAHQPRTRRLSVCHGDLVFTNLFVDRGRVTGVYDWSKAALADPAFDVAATRVRLASDVPGLPRALRLVQRSMERRYLASYQRRRPVDASALRYFETFWTLNELAWGLQKSTEGVAPTSDIRDRWLHPDVQAAALVRLSESTQLSLAVSVSSGR